MILLKVLGLTALALAVQAQTDAAEAEKQRFLSKTMKESMKEKASEWKDLKREAPPASILGSDSARLAGCVNGLAAGRYPCKNVELLSYLSRTDMGRSRSGNDIWGWIDPETRAEIAVVGQYEGVSFVDVTDAANPVWMGRLASTRRRGSSWHDVKVRDGYAYIVSEERRHGMQVVDLRQFREEANRDPNVAVKQLSFYNKFGSAHNVVINEDSDLGMAVGATTCRGGLSMFSTADPSNIRDLGCFSSDGYTHDAQIVSYTSGPHKGKEIVFASNEDTLTIVDVTDRANPKQLSRTGYSGSRYTHQSWIDPDNPNYLLLDDEKDEESRGGPKTTATYIWDITNLSAPRMIKKHLGTVPAIDHNLYINNRLAFESNYSSGLRILDTTRIDRAELTEVAFFDVAPNNSGVNFKGAWSSYVFIGGSRNVITSGIESGLFVLRPDYAAIDAERRFGAAK